MCCRDPGLGWSFKFDRHDTFASWDPVPVRALPDAGRLRPVAHDHFLQSRINRRGTEVRTTSAARTGHARQRSADRSTSAPARWRQDLHRRPERISGARRRAVDADPGDLFRKLASRRPASPARSTSSGFALRPSATTARSAGRRDSPAARSSASARPVEWLCDTSAGWDLLPPFPSPRWLITRRFASELGRKRDGGRLQGQAQHDGQARRETNLIVPESARPIRRWTGFFGKCPSSASSNIPISSNGSSRGRLGASSGSPWNTSTGRITEDVAQADPGLYPVHQACRMTCQVLKGLEQAHSMGFVHRDIKPENILIGKTERGLIAKISDFGLAKSCRGLGLSGAHVLRRRCAPGPLPSCRRNRCSTSRPSRRRATSLRHGGHALLPALLPVHLRRPRRRGDLIRTLLEEPPVHDPQASVRRSPRGSAAELERLPGARPERPLRHGRRDALALRPFC